MVAETVGFSRLYRSLPSINHGSWGGLAHLRQSKVRSGTCWPSSRERTPALRPDGCAQILLICLLAW